LLLLLLKGFRRRRMEVCCVDGGDGWMDGWGVYFLEREE